MRRSHSALLSAVALTAASWLAGSASLADATTPATTSTTTSATTSAAMQSAVTLEQIMADPDWLGGAPENPYWSADGRTIYFERDPADEADDDARLWRLVFDADSATSATEMVEVPLAELSTVESADGDWSDDRQRKVYALGGDIFLLDLAQDGSPRQLTRTAARESNPLFLTGDQQVAFQRDDTWLVRDLDNGLEWQPAEVVAGDDPAAEELADEFLAQQQRRLFDVVREDQATQVRRRERESERRRLDPGSVPPPFYLGKGKEILASTLSPAGDALLLVTAPEGRDEGKKAQMPNYLGEDGYVEVRDVRSKVGVGGDFSHGLILLDLVDREIHPIDLSALPGISEDPLAELKAATKTSQDAGSEEAAGDESAEDDESAEKEAASEPDDDATRQIRILRTAWSRDGESVAVMVRAHDNKDRWISVLSREHPEPTVVHRLTLEGWINWDHNDMDWLPDGRLWFLSEETGTSHLYVFDPHSGDTAALTSGDFVVADPQADPSSRFLYVVANPDRPTSYDVYRVASTGGDLERLTQMGGLVEFQLSPTGQHLLVRNSQLVEPPELFVQEARAGAVATQLTDTTSEDFESLPWIAPEIVQIPSKHQQRPIWGRYYPPRHPDLLRDREGKVPAVVFVHGAGYLQNAHEGWSGYFREFMFHTFLAERGYAVLDLDYRGSKGYGADWRQAIYRHMGQPELEDLLDGHAWLVTEHDVDPARVGIYGGSYGGFMVMMALFKEPGVFAAGAALRPVTDWAHYNHGYTSNILNTPDVDPEAYARSSPIEFAAGLEDPLLICAPMLDDNVHFQDVVRLTQKLIELDKTSFEVALFPIEPHGFRRPSSWLHEYRRIYDLFDRHLRPE